MKLMALNHSGDDGWLLGVENGDGAMGIDIGIEEFSFDTSTTSRDHIDDNDNTSLLMGSTTTATTTADDAPNTPLTQEDKKRMRNRASVEKCRRKKRHRLSSLNKERDALTEENKILTEISRDIRTSMILILTEIANLSIPV